MNIFDNLIDIRIEKNMGIAGLTDEFFCVYLNNLYEKYNKNILVVVNSLYEANQLYSSLKTYNDSFVVYRNKEMNIHNDVKHYDYGFFTCASSVYRFNKYNQSSIDTFVSIGKHTSKAIRECYGDVKILETNKAVKDYMIDIVLRGE